MFISEIVTRKIPDELWESNEFVAEFIEKFVALMDKGESNEN